MSLWITITALALTLGACGDDTSGCTTPGQQEACFCPSGSPGLQVCQPNGDYGACLCTTPMDAGAILDASFDAGFDAGNDAGPMAMPCDPNPCMNGGRCSEAGDSYSCSCSDGFIGEECETVDACAGSPCGSNGTCTMSGSSFTCDCNDGHIGELCDMPEEQTYGQLRNPASNFCLDSFGRVGDAQMNTCHGLRGNQEFLYNVTTGQLRNPATDLCLDSFGRLGAARMNTCHGDGGNQEWVVDDLGVWQNPASGYCLDSFGRIGDAMVNGCNGIGGNQEFVGSP